MIWRFSIIDRNNVTTVIDEPVGWDDISIAVTRDKDMHGIFFDYQKNEFDYDGLAMEILKSEKAAYGIDGIVTLVIEYSCGQGFQELYRGRFVFGKYSSTCGDECFVKIPIETSGDVMELRNKIDQPVDLEALKGFDEVTELPAYDRLPLDIMLPSKGVLIRDYSLVKENTNSPCEGVSPVLDGSGNPYATIGGEVWYTFGFSSENIAEIGNFTVTDLIMKRGELPAVTPKDMGYSIVDYVAGSANYGNVNGDVTIRYAYVGSLLVQNCSVGQVHVVMYRLPNRPENANNGDSWLDYEEIARDVIFEVSDINQYKQPGDIISFNSVITRIREFEEGDIYYLFFYIRDRKTIAQQVAVRDGAPAYTITMNSGSFFQAQNLSKTNPTRCKSFMMNEALSRSAEAITNGKIRVLSDYFGRTDSQPYARPADGCGSLATITKGLFIRRQDETLSDRPPVMAISLKQMFDGLDPIHHIGFGIEADPYRPGFNCLRVEHWRYFYSSEVILTCANVSKIDVETQDDEHYSLFSFGYEKWEAEEYTGLDEFLTKRKYRTTLNSINNELTKLSKFVASGYAIEITRRKGNEDSKDWRYDNDTFIICLTRTIVYKVTFVAAENKMTFETYSDTHIFLVGSITIAGTSFNNGTRSIMVTSISSNGPGQPSIVEITFSGGATVNEVSDSVTFTNLDSGLFVEQGKILSPENIIDPDSIYNYRISPVRNAMRWFDAVSSGFVQPGKIIFTDGDGNFWAKGQYSGTCVLESGPVAENGPIDSSSFNDSTLGAPLLQPERVTFDYDMSVSDFLKVKSNPYGLIEYYNDCESGYGWIDEISYRPNDGMASFKLIPKK